MRSSARTSRGDRRGRGPARRLARGLLLTIVAIAWAPGDAVAQITTTSDDDPAPPGSIREEVANAAPGATLDVQIGAEGGSETISLRETLVFSQDVTIDNSSTDTAFVRLDAPAATSFLVLNNDAVVVLRDVGLTGDATVSSDDIDLQTAGSRLVLDVERQDQIAISDIVGLGALEKRGSAALELTGNNDFAGGLTIEDGDVLADVDALGTGAIELAPNASTKAARLIFGAGNQTLGATGPVITDGSSGGGIVGLVKRGTGRLDVVDATIAGTLGFTIEAGELRAGASGLTAGIDFDVAEGATLSLDPGTTVVSAASELAGAGRIEIEADDLTFTADPSAFTGTLELDPGNTTMAPARVTFQLGTAPAATLSFDAVVDDATVTLEIDNAVDATFAGAVSGAGRFAKSGVGTLTLTGAHTYTGATMADPARVNAGRLVGNTSNLPGYVALGVGADLDFQQGANGTYADVVSDGGAGSVVRKLGAGTLTFTQAQTFAGDFRLEAGGLRFSAGSGLTNAGLTVGVGGATPVRLAADFDASAAPGAAINTYAIGGDLDIDTDAVVTVGIAATNDVATVYDASGAVTIADGARLAVEPADGTYGDGQTWAVLRGASVTELDDPMIPGVGFEIDQSLFFFTLTGAVVAEPGGQAYRLTLNDNTNTFAAAGRTANQRTIGARLDTFRSATGTGDPRIDAYQEALTSATADSIGTLLDSVSPDDLAASTNAQLAGAARTWRGLSQRALLQRRGWIGRPSATARRPRRSARPSVDAGPASVGATGDAESLRANEAGDASPEGAPRWTAWLAAGGVLGDLESDDAKGVDYVAAGPLIGAERRFGRDALAGFAFSGGYSGYETEAGDGEGDGGDVGVTLYGAWLGEPLQALLGVRYARAWVETERTIRAGSIVERADGELDGDVFGVFAELSRGFALSSLAGGVDVAPLASVAWTHVAWQGFGEGGPSPLRIEVDDQTVDSVVTGLGLRVSAERRLEDGTYFRPRGKLVWQREWADVERDVEGRFASDALVSAGAFEVSGAEVPRDAAEVGLGWDVGFVENANLFVDWEARFAADLVEHTLSLGGRVVW